MNYLLVFITFLVLSMTMIGVALLGSDRIFPARKFFIYIPNDGILCEEGPDQPLILSEHPDQEELKRIKFATSFLGYKKDEVEQTLSVLSQENQRLRELLDDQKQHV